MTRSPSAICGACAGFSDFDRTNLRNAARLFVDGRGRTIRLVERVGLTLGKVTTVFGTSVVHLFGRNGERKYHSLVEQALQRAFELATLGLKPEGHRKPPVWMHKALETVVAQPVASLVYRDSRPTCLSRLA